ncbi:MAG: hypothetical protein ACW99F_03860 [Candidatus Hodarchaeales archaeon]|jgi:hypothetical protein
MQVEQLEVPHEEAKKQIAALKQLFKENDSVAKNKIYRDLKRAYGHMQHGGKVIDIFKAFKDAGENENGNPKIAIVRADGKKCYCTKLRDGAAVFSHDTGGIWNRRAQGSSVARKSYNEIQVPENTFSWDHIPWNKRVLSTIAPIIPPVIMIEQVRYNLKNYHILFEVDAWKLEPPVDPILLKQINGSLFAVLATWDLTNIERAIIKQHIT